MEGCCAGWVMLKKPHKVGQRFMGGTDMSQSPQSHQLKASEMHTWCLMSHVQRLGEAHKNPSNRHLL